ncbi:MAG: glycosyltransferase family 39 protein, partial [Fuerstia sp.]|nr:glycosyltransferase family 39 protein [Fuerstiella sp.]
MVSTSNWFRHHIVPLGLTTVHVVLLAISGAWHSPTENEAQHLVAGLHHLHTGTFGLYRVNPPLVKTVAALPVAVTGYTPDWSGYTEMVGARPVFDMGEDFIRKNGRRSFRMITMARWFCMPFSVVGAWVCFLWARDLYGKSSGDLACCLWCFSPMVLGNASIITPDAHATALGLAACYTFWRWLKQPTWMQAMVTGGVLGLAELSKTTLVLFYPLWPIIWLSYRLPNRRTMTRKLWQREAGMLILRMAIGIYILNLGYLFEGSFAKLRDFHFVSQMFKGDAAAEKTAGNRFHDSWLGAVPVPFPANYVIGIDIQQRDFEKFSRPSYLLGRYQATGWWYY